MHFDEYYIGKIPIYKAEKSSQKNIITNVNKVLSFIQSSDYLQNPAKQAKVKEHEKEIDRMVYELYRLTDEEIAIVEGKRAETSINKTSMGVTKKK